MKSWHRLKKIWLWPVLLLATLCLLALLAFKADRYKSVQYRLQMSEKCVKVIEDLTGSSASAAPQETPVKVDVNAVVLVSGVYPNFLVQFQGLSFDAELAPGNHAVLALGPKEQSLLVNGQNTPLPENAGRVLTSIFSVLAARNGELVIKVTSGAPAEIWTKLGLDPFTILSMGFFGAQLSWHPGAIKKFNAHLSELPDVVAIPILASLSAKGPSTSSFQGETNDVQSHTYPGQMPLKTHTKFRVSVTGETTMSSRKLPSVSNLKLQLGSDSETSREGKLAARMSIKDYEMNLELKSIAK